MLLDGVAATRFDEADLRCAIGFFAEDAHIFATTIRDNLLVARGDRRDDELTAALGAVGLDGWLAGLPEGLATVLIGGAQSLSAGQRRRLLLARAVLSPARIVLLDEPTEHLDVTDAEKVLRDLLAPDSRLLSPSAPWWWPLTTCPRELAATSCASITKPELTRVRRAAVSWPGAADGRPGARHTSGSRACGPARVRP